ncbi:MULTISPECIES: serine protease [Burkholderia]|uniref:serine protease n=1 Tax=Burkholderia TaxID=32008 RepID=UPI001F60540C|nr:MULTISPECIES: serine protease [Burkholderia]MCI3967981.1 serine protease [Burkholderia sp. HI4860]MDN7791729.1 serine protease [Burkholderia contaminans]
MQDITGHYAIPLALPFSDVPPPYGRRRRPFVASRRARQYVFDIHGQRRVPAAAAARGAKAARVARPVRAEDFGSDNRAWVRPHPLRRRWKMTLLATAMFGVVCVVATHLIDERQHGATPGNVYAAAISIAPTAAVAAAEVAHATGRPAEVAIVPADHSAPTDARVTTATQAVAAESRALHAGADASASAPVDVAMVVASDAVVAEVAAPAPAALAGRASSAGKPVAVKSRATAQPAVALRGKTARGMPQSARGGQNGAVAAHGAAAHAQQAATAADVSPAAPASSAAQAVGMTAAEFTQWLAATRDTARPAAGGMDLTVNLPGHTRLTER